LGASKYLTQQAKWISSVQSIIGATEIRRSIFSAF